jgi:hypothetical protein
VPSAGPELGSFNEPLQSSPSASHGSQAGLQIANVSPLSPSESHTARHHLWLRPSTVPNCTVNKSQTPGFCLSQHLCNGALPGYVSVLAALPSLLTACPAPSGLTAVACAYAFSSLQNVSLLTLQNSSQMPLKRPSLAHLEWPRQSLLPHRLAQPAPLLTDSCHIWVQTP